MAKKLFRSFALKFLPFLASLLIRFLYITNKKVFHTKQDIDNTPIIFACWHGELLMLPFLYQQYRKKTYAKVLISDHFDGKLIAKTVSYFDLDTIHGSSNKNASKVLLQAIKAIKNGYDIGITPDGPRGPRHKVSDGVVAIAKKTGAKIMLINIIPTRYWQLNSWDRFIIPKPFGTLNYYATPPIDILDMQDQEAKTFIEKKLLEHSCA